MERRIVVLFFVLVMVVLVAAQCQQPASSTESPAATGSPATPLRKQGTTATAATAATEATAAGAALLQERCTVCHNLARVENAKKSGDEWTATVQRMVGKGANLSPAEQESLVKYLAATYK